MNTLEIIAVALGLANVGLLVRRSIWNYPFGMAMVTLYFFIFWEARLYAESGLQIFFFVVQAWGWYLWAQAGGLQEAVAVRWLGWPARIVSLVCVGLVTIGLGWGLTQYTDAAMAHIATILLLGSGELGREFVISAKRLGARVIACDSYDNAPAMGGPFTIWSAAAVPGRIKAAAAFHAGGLVRDDYDKSPHKLLADTEANFLIGVAQDDDADAPDEKDVLAQAAEAAGRPAVIEVYAGDHGWTVPDSPVYNEPEAERAYAAKLELYSGAL